MTKPKIIYITSWYNEKNAERKLELSACLHNTMTSGNIDELWLLNEDSTITEWIFPDVWQLHVVNISRRPTYNDFFKLANKVGKDGDIVIIANTDIYPEVGMRKFIESIGQNDCYALSRYDEDEQGNKIFFDRWDSQDVWIFRTPIWPIKGDFFQGTAACDNAIAERAYKLNYNVQNPSRTIKFNHLHNSGIRAYNPDIKVPKPYLLITPHNLGETPSYHFIQ